MEVKPSEQRIDAILPLKEEVFVYLRIKSCLVSLIVRLIVGVFITESSSS